MPTHLQNGNVEHLDVPHYQQHNHPPDEESVTSTVSFSAHMNECFKCGHAFLNKFFCRERHESRRVPLLLARPILELHHQREKKSIGSLRRGSSL